MFAVKEYPLLFFFLTLLSLTNTLQTGFSHERLDRSAALKEIVLKTLKKAPHSQTATPTTFSAIKMHGTAPIKLTTAQLMGSHSAIPQTLKNSPIPTTFTATPAVIHHFVSADYRSTGQYGPSSEAGKGKTQIIVGEKGRIISFLPDGTPDNVLNISHDRFFSSVSRGSFTADPNIIYDSSAGRWFLFCKAFPSILLAMSDSDPVVPETVWSFFVIDSTFPNPGFDAILPNFDYTTLGLDQNAIYCATNVFDDANPLYLSSAVYVILKDSLINGSPEIFPFRNLVNQKTMNGPYTPQGALNFDSNPTEGFFISENLLDILQNSSNQLLINKVLFTATGPVLSATQSIPITPFIGPIFAPALGSPNPIFDPGTGLRLGGAHIRNGILHVVHEIGVNNQGVSTPAITPTRNGSRFYAIATRTMIPTVVSQGTVFQASAHNDFNQRSFLVPSIMSNINNQIIISATTCGAQERLNASVTQIVNGIPGTPVVYTESTSNYFPTEDWEFDPNPRWGDHTRLSIDPNDNTTFWAATMWCNATNTWATDIAQVVVS